MNEIPADPLNIPIGNICEELRIRPEIYVKLLKSFSETLADKMKLLNAAISVKDADQARMLLHEIKGTSANLRLHNISGPEAILHQAVKFGDSQQNISRFYEMLLKESERLHQFAHNL